MGEFHVWLNANNFYANSEFQYKTPGYKIFLFF